MSLYEVLKASKTERFPDYWTLLWGRKMSASMIKTITGVLPLTFTAKGGTAVDWTIYGNDDVGENLFDKTTSVDGSYVTTTGTQSASNAAHSDYIPVEASQSYYLTDVVGISVFYSAVEYDNNKSAIGYSNISGSSKVSGAITTSSNAAYVCINFKPANLDTIMLVKGSTAPDHYIPYQQGVGERTAQMFTDTVGKQVITATAGTNFVTIINNFMTLAAGRYTIHYYQSTSMTSNTRNTLLVFTVATGVQIYESSATNHNLDAGWYSWTFDIPNDGSYQVRIWIVNASDEVKATNFILTKGETATPTEYIPYGYQIPFIVSQQGQTDKNYDIYIGDSPLTEGETVSKTSTGVDIELFEGENTVSTTLYNKPTMEIKYK